MTTNTVNKSGHINFSKGSLTGKLVKDTEEHVARLLEIEGDNGTTCNYIGNYTNKEGIQNSKEGNILPLNEDERLALEEMKEIGKLRSNIYSKLLVDISESMKGNEGKKIFFQVPLSHAHNFIPFIIEQKSLELGVLNSFEVEYAVVDNDKIVNYEGDIEKLGNEYEQFISKAVEADKFIQIVDTTRGLKTFLGDENTEQKDYMSKLEMEVKKGMKKGKNNNEGGVNKLRLYFPTKEMAEKEGKTELEFYELYNEAISLDWNRMKGANAELTNLLSEYDSVRIQGEGTDIEFGIQGMGAINSVIQSNWPGSEVYTAPVLEEINGKISFNNPVYIKMLDEKVDGISMEFKNGILINFEIHSDSGENVCDIEKRLEDELNRLPGNRKVGELAFGTNFFIPAGIVHPLIGEKAEGMHLALGHCLKIDNGNTVESGETDIHWDVIRDMKDAKVTLGKTDSNEEIIIMNKGHYSSEHLPLLDNYKKEIQVAKGEI